MKHDNDLFSIEWLDGGREPTQPSNPDYPNGFHFDASRGAAETCTVALPYPARRCGAYRLVCNFCGLDAMVTTAGRADDPRSVKLACKFADA